MKYKHTLLEELILRAVSGEPSPWDIDPRFKPTGNFQLDFNAGDKQTLLWAIVDCAKKGKPIPDWAAQALDNIMCHGVARGKFASWEEAFGPIRVKQQRTIQGLQHMVAVWEKIRQLHEQENRSIDDTLFEDVRAEFAIGIGKVKEYYGRKQRFIEEHPDVWNRASNASVTRK